MELTRSHLLDDRDSPGASERLRETIIAPVLNAAVIEPVNILSHFAEDISGKTISPGELKPFAVRKVEPYTCDWFVQSAASGAGSLLPFLASGKLAGSLMSHVATSWQLEGTAAKILNNKTVAQISGAGVYAAMKRPQEGESRIGNALATMGAFSIFELGNVATRFPMFKQEGLLPFVGKTAIRMGSGFAGGAAQIELQSVIGQQKLADTNLVVQNGVSGAALNLSMGLLHDTVSGGNGQAAKKTEGGVPKQISLSGERGLMGNSAESSAAKMLNAKSNIAKPDAQGSVVYIVIDSGFSPESLPPEPQILRTWDLTGEGVFNDPLQHGSVVLSKLRDADPEAKFILIKAYDSQNNLAQTQFENGQIARPGWTEAYLDSVSIAKQLKLPSVANCSFGEFTHAMDGTGWESFQLSKAIGTDKAGHVVVAAAGSGNGIARHASGTVESNASETVHISQNGEAAFNLWFGKDSPRDWNFSVFDGNRKIYSVDGSQLEPNFWNNRQQLTFRSQMENAATRFVLSRNGNDTRPLSFDFYIKEGPATFRDHVNPTLIAEPAVFPDVVAVGIKNLSYSNDQALAGQKPDVLLPGDGPISFRTPEVTARIGSLLKANPSLDAKQIQALLAKEK